MSAAVHGLVPILATPFLPSGELDLPSLRKLTEFVVTSGVDGVAVFGMASEGFALTADERQRILSEVTGVVAGAIPVVAGIAATSTATATALLREAESGGASALMVLPPYFVKPTSQQLVDFYGELGAATTTEIMVQDAPGATGVAMPTTLIRTLSTLHGVRSIKVEAPPTAPKIGALNEVLDPAFGILGGQNSQFLLDEFARGSIGTMPACEFVDLLGPIVADLRGNRRRHAAGAFAQLLPALIFGLQPGIAWAVHKEVLVRRGIIGHTTVRPPARPADAGTLACLNAVLARLDLRLAPRL